MANTSSVWDTYARFYSSTSTQTYLNKCYSKTDISNKASKSYENCYPFIYYLEHGQTYFTQAKQSPLSIQPVLIFYGFIQLIKACLLTVDPNYPESTTLLAHGVTTRKRKKQQYEFFHDEVKVQRNGLFSNMADKMFNIKYLEADKFKMGPLLYEIPELYESHLYLHSKKNYEVLKGSENRYEIPSSVLDQYKMTANRFTDYLSSKTNRQFSIKENSFFELNVESRLTYNNMGPIRYHLFNENFMVSLNKESSCLTLPELMIHYLILYNLSMICRYETEWWSELIKTTPNNDYPSIVQFLTITQEKIPFLIYQWLSNERFNKTN